MTKRRPRHNFRLARIPHFILIYALELLFHDCAISEDCTSGLAGGCITFPRSVTIPPNGCCFSLPALYRRSLYIPVLQFAVSPLRGAVVVLKGGCVRIVPGKTRRQY